MIYIIHYHSSTNYFLFSFQVSTLSILVTRHRSKSVNIVYQNFNHSKINSYIFINNVRDFLNRVKNILKTFRTTKYDKNFHMQFTFIWCPSLALSALQTFHAKGVYFLQKHKLFAHKIFWNGKDWKNLLFKSHDSLSFRV